MSTASPQAPLRAADSAGPTQGPRATLPSPRASGLVAWAFLGVFVVAAIWSIIDLRINIASILDSWDNAVDFVGRSLPLDFPEIGDLIELLAQTLAIVTAATALSMVISFVAALAAARNTRSGPTMQRVSRTFIVIMRAVPELIMAIIFMRIFGFGALAGILAIGLSSIGMVGKLYTDAIEDLDDGPRRALQAAGAARGQQNIGAVLLQALPALIATGLHRFDINLRVSVVLGFVGVAGIGEALATALDLMNYSRGMALALIVLLLCIAVELLSGAIRMRLLGRAEPSRFGVLWLLRRLAPAREGRLPERATIPPWDAHRIARVTSLSVTGLILVVALIVADIDWSRAVTGLMDMPRTLGMFLPPDDGGIGPMLLVALVETMQIALAATFIGALLALPLGFLAAENVAPNRQVATCCRIIIVVVRGIPELILAIVFIVISGIGAVAGTLALAVGAMGLLSKLIADSVEETDVRVQQAVGATGALRSQVFFAATIRQAAPAVVGHLIYQLDVNFRSATLLGIVGAGGIGFYLLNAASVLRFEVVTHILILVVAVVLVLEAVAMLMRRMVR